MQHTCPLCGGKLSALRLEQHSVPRYTWHANFRNERLSSSVMGFTSYPHLWMMGDRKISMYACVDCGHVQAIKEEDE